MNSLRMPMAALLATSTLLFATTAIAEVIDGTPGDDDLTGTDAADRIDGGDGHDRLQGKGGSDVLIGGQGDDELIGDAGNDDLRGGAGADVMRDTYGRDRFTTTGIDVVHAGRQSDHVTTGPGAATVHGGFGIDEFSVEGPGAQRLYGGPGGDLMTTTSRSDGQATMFGGAGNDLLETQSELATMYGGPGNDTLEMESDHGGQDAFGGTGDDAIYTDTVDPAERNDIVCGSGVDRLYADPADVFGSDCEHVTIVIWGTSGSDTILGTRYDDHVLGWEGDDVVTTDAGDDRFFGHQDLSDGVDEVSLGEGDDYAFTTGDGNVDVVHCGDGTDTVKADAFDDIDSDCEIVERGSAQPTRSSNS